MKKTAKNISLLKLEDIIITATAEIEIDAEEDLKANRLHEAKAKYIILRNMHSNHPVESSPRWHNGYKRLINELDGEIARREAYQSKKSLAFAAKALRGLI